MIFRRSQTAWTCLFLVTSAVAASNPLQSLGDGLNAAINSTNQALQSATTSAGSVVTSAANDTASALKNATSSVGGGLNVTINATDSAAQNLASSGANLAAGVINATGISSVVGGPIASAIEGVITNGVRHPVVFWPGFGTSRLRTEVSEQELEPDCPGSGAFHTAFGNPTILEGWPESCIYKLLQLQYDPDLEDFNQRFSSQPGVNATMPYFGSTLCAPIPYEPMYLFFQAVGYTVGYDFFVACYDWRTSPFQNVVTDGAHLDRAKGLVEEAYANTGRPVYLLGHSNGPLYALALLNTTTDAWRSKYVAGFIAYAGNWAGQGGTFAPIFSGQSLFDNSWYSSAAPAFESWPAAYMQLADPATFNNSETVIQAIVDGQTVSYTPSNYSALFEDANLTLAQELAPELVGNLTARSALPGTHFYGFYGSGLQTLVGVALPNLTQGISPQANGNFYADGDSNQEATDNLSALRWNQTQNSCFHFELNEEKGVSHLTMPLSPGVLQKTVNILFTDPKNCSQNSSPPTAAAAG